MKKEIFFRDPVVQRVVEKFVSRSDVGFKKYGTTLHEERTQGLKGLFKYVNDVQEELMDAVLYLQAVKEEIQDLTEEAVIMKFADETPISQCAMHDFQQEEFELEERMNIIGQNGNNGEHYEDGWKPEHDGHMLDNDSLWQ
jgi:hypothetical protein